MWIFTKYGFFSAVSARTGNGQLGNPVDPDRMMVRARMEVHLKDLRKRFRCLSRCKIVESAGTDYAFRMFVPKEAWVEVMSGLASEVDYDNFKDAVVRHADGREDRPPSYDDLRYETSLHAVWDVMAGLQDRALDPKRR
jgi:hypothetical protein